MDDKDKACKEVVPTKYYFADPAKQAELKRILDEWIRTPFRHHCGVKGLGCDCIHFVIRVFEEMGRLKEGQIKIPDYPHDWHLHNTRELLLERMLERAGKGRIVPADLNAPMNGDLILSHYGAAASHAAFYFDGHVYQAVNKIGVCKISFSDPIFRKQMKYAYRLMA